MVKIQSVLLLLCLSIVHVYAGSYGNSLNTQNYYPYTGSYVGSNTGSQYGGYSGYGNTGYGTGYSGQGNSYGTSIYKNVVLPYHYPVPYPVPIDSHTGSRTLILRNGGGISDGLLGFGDSGIFGFIFMLIILQYILQIFRNNQVQTTTPNQNQG